MKLIERYIFRRTMAGLLVTIAALSATVWLSQALREFDLVTARGQSLVTFFHVALLIFPTLVMIIGPVAVLIAVIYTLNGLTADSELPIISASGGSWAVVLRPILAVALIMMVVVASITLYFSPLTQRAGRNLTAEINSDLLTSVIREGQFLRLGSGLTLHIKERNPDRSLSGIFVADEREPAETVTYLADRGMVLDNPLGTFLIMQDGLIQRETHANDALSIIEFRSYAFDLSTLARSGEVVSYKPDEQPTAYLLAPDPADPYFQEYPHRFRSELHDRLSSPLYSLVFALVPLAFLGRARTTRDRTGGMITAAVAVALTARGAGFFLVGAAATNPMMIPLLYILPLSIAFVCLLVVAGVIDPRLPRPVAVLVDEVTARLRGLGRGRAAMEGTAR